MHGNRHYIKTVADSAGGCHLLLHQPCFSKLYLMTSNGCCFNFCDCFYFSGSFKSTIETKAMEKTLLLFRNICDHTDFPLLSHALQLLSPKHVDVERSKKVKTVNLN